MTPSAVDFVTPLTLSTLSKNAVESTFFNDNDTSKLWNNHVEIALWADLIVVAPATANTLSKMANGTCDNLLLAVYLSAKCPVYFAPAMDLDMHKHQSTRNNFIALESFGNIMIPSETGELASGLSGEGRMAEPENILEFIKNNISAKLPLSGKKILITAGPTYEAIDPVRFIGNHSSGKMGYDIAKYAASMGAEVTIVSGPTNQLVENQLVNEVKVVSAQQMFDTCFQYYDAMDIVIAAAAVADYKPKNIAAQKIKKSENSFTIELEKTKDILSTMGLAKKNQFLIGFALETENEIENAILKIKKKNLDLIILNSMNDEGAGFGTETNKVTFIDKNLVVLPMDLKSKEAVAFDIVNKIIEHYA
jgi:phosphopantothenoylcysteine decarboxylase/phosphopantothenate--cysteine ligase